MKTRETKRQRQLINRAHGFKGSLMPRERAQSLLRRQGQDPTNEDLIADIRRMDRVCNHKRLEPVS